MKCITFKYKLILIALEQVIIINQTNFDFEKCSLGQHKKL